MTYRNQVPRVGLEPTIVGITADLLISHLRSYGDFNAIYLSRLYKYIIP